MSSAEPTASPRPFLARTTPGDRGKLARRRNARKGGDRPGGRRVTRSAVRVRVLPRVDRDRQIALTSRRAATGTIGGGPWPLLTGTQAAYLDVDRGPGGEGQRIQSLPMPDD